jgi:hypothetical protein
LGVFHLKCSDKFSFYSEAKVLLEDNIRSGIITLVPSLLLTSEDRRWAFACERSHLLDPTYRDCFPKSCSAEEEFNSIASIATQIRTKDKRPEGKDRDGIWRRVVMVLDERGVVMEGARLAADGVSDFTKKGGD